jgi:hypothetical protein
MDGLALAVAIKEYCRSKRNDLYARMFWCDTLLCHDDAMILDPPANEEKRTPHPWSPQPEQRRLSTEKSGSNEPTSQPVYVRSSKVDPAVKEWLDKVLGPAMVRIYLAGDPGDGRTS